jgi:hypothetical protein
MGSETNQADVNPFEIGQITERLPAWELWEDGDGIEPADELPKRDRERAA